MMELGGVLRDLAAEVGGNGPSGETGRLRLRQGRVVSVEADGTVTVTVGGAEDAPISGVRVAAHVCPVADATCWLVVDGRDLFVMTMLAPSGPAHAYMEKSTAQVASNGVFTEAEWASRQNEYAYGVTVGSSGFTVVTPGLYRVIATALWAGNGAGMRLTEASLNGVRLEPGSSVFPTTTNGPRVAAVRDVRCVQGDVVGMRVWQNGAGALNLEVQSSLSVTWIGPYA